MTSSSISVILPAYNEGPGIHDLVRRIKAVLPASEIIVVDDGSDDDTAARAAEAGAVTVSCTYNIGNGAAIKMGARRASGDILVFMDADGQHRPEDIPSLLELIGRYDMVVGARPWVAKGPLVRKLGNRVLIKLAESLTRRRIPDLTSGFRAVKRERFMNFIHLLPDGYSYPTTITLAMIMSAHFVKYVDLPGIGERRHGASKINLIQDGVRFVNIILRMVMLFCPQRIFVPIGLLFLGAGCGMAVFQIVTRNGVFGSSIILWCTGVFTFFFGLLADQIAQIRRQVK